MSASAIATVGIVVLGGGLSDDGLFLDERSAERCVRAATMFNSIHKGKEHPASVSLICSGAWAITRADPPPRTEAALMADIAIQLGVPPEQILRDERSLDTIGNLAVVGSDILPKLNPDQIIVVSSDFHMRRVRYLVKRVWGTRWNVAFGASHSNLPLLSRARLSLRERRLMLRMRRILRGIAPGDIEACLRVRPVSNRLE